MNKKGRFGGFSFLYLIYTRYIADMKNTMLLFQLPEPMREEFRKKCRRKERTMSAQLRMLITDFIQEDEQ